MMKTMLAAALLLALPAAAQERPLSHSLVTPFGFAGPVPPGAIPRGPPPPISPDDRSVIAPYRFNPPPDPMTPLEQQKAQAYRFELQQHLESAQRRSMLGPPDPMQQRDIQNLQIERDRINGVLGH
jgi:hypothetical protein